MVSDRAFFLHPSHEDLSLGTPAGRRPREAAAPPQAV
jgi:hypothetical protein